MNADNSTPVVGSQMVMTAGSWAGSWTRTVTVVGTQESLSHGLRYLVAWPSNLATDPLLPGQATTLCSADALRSVS